MNLLQALAKTIATISTLIASIFLPPTTSTAPATTLSAPTATPTTVVATPPPTQPETTPMASPAEKHVSPKPAKKQTPNTPSSKTTQVVAPVVPLAAENANENEAPVVIHRIIPPGPTQPLDPLDVLALTDKERAKVGDGMLSWNESLAAEATTKAQDLITNHYFAHVSPSGVGVQDLAKRFNYDYSLIGENLAMGDFVSDADLMNGWMNSPGHRANILKKGYTELGVAVVQTYSQEEGHNIWYAVQEFGRPAPNCPKPDASENALIIAVQSSLDSLRTQLADKKATLNADSGNPIEQQTLVDDYNALVATYNNALAKLKTTTDDYNGKVNAYNSCIAAAQAAADGGQ